MRHPFEIDAMVVMPDHLHCIWTLPQGDSDFSMRWRLIKSYFSRKCQKPVGWVEQSETQQKVPSRLKRRNKMSGSVVFWKHLIRNEQDFIRHVEYIHYNPVRHGYVTDPKDWEYSSFHRYVRDRVYDPKWGAGAEITFDSTVGHE